MSREKQDSGLIYGIVSGLVFAIATWGIDAIILAGAHTSLPFIKFVPGMIACVLAGGFVGWLNIRLDNGIIGALLWLVYGIFLVWLIIFIPFNTFPALLKLFDPSLTPVLDFTKPDGIWQFWIFGLIIVGGPTLICGIIQNNLIDHAIGSSYQLAKLNMLLIPIILMVVAGLSADHMNERNLRDPITATNRLLEFARDNYGKDVDPKLARAMQLNSTKELGNLVGQPYKLTLIGYDNTLGTVEVLLDFPRNRATCTVVYSQPVRCSQNQGHLNWVIGSNRHPIIPM